jgi:hypothetical protein
MNEFIKGNMYRYKNDHDLHFKFFGGAELKGLFSNSLGNKVRIGYDLLEPVPADFEVDELVEVCDDPEFPAGLVDKRRFLFDSSASEFCHQHDDQNIIVTIDNRRKGGRMSYKYVRKIKIIERFAVEVDGETLEVTKEQREQFDAFMRDVIF